MSSIEHTATPPPEARFPSGSKRPRRERRAPRAGRFPLGAILRHEESLGEEDAPRFEDVPRARHWPRLARIGAGLAVSAVTTPFLYLLVSPPTHLLVPVALLTALTGVLGSQAGFAVTRREITSWADRFVARMQSVFRGEVAPPPADASDFEGHLVGLARTLELQLERQVRAERDAVIATITSLVSALEARDPHTRNHSTRVAQLAVRVGKEMGLSRPELYELHLGGLLHDIGKIGVPDGILRKPSRLTREEYEVMKGHPTLGARIVSSVPGLESVVRIVLHHHEAYDGSGYPDGLAGDDIPLGARIVAAADTYLSMAEDRPYRPAQSLDHVVRELRRVAGRQLDPDVVDALLVMVAKETEQFGMPLMGTYGPDLAATEPDPPRQAA